MNKTYEMNHAGVRLEADFERAEWMFRVKTERPPGHIVWTSAQNDELCGQTCDVYREMCGGLKRVGTVRFVDRMTHFPMEAREVE